MTSMKFCKPSFNYGARQSNFPKYEHKEHHKMSQSSHAEHGWAIKPNYGPRYYSQAQGTQMGHASYGLYGDDSGNSWDGDSTNYYAQAQSVCPTPSIHVQKAQHMMEKKESHMAQEWSSDGAKCSSPARANSGMEMMGKMDHGWANKPGHCSSSTRMGEYGASMYQGQEGNAYQYAKNGANSSWASKPTNFSGGDQSSQMMYAQHEQHGWADGPTKYPSTVKTNHSSLGMHKEDNIMGNLDHGWDTSPTKINTSSIAMHNEGHTMGTMDHGWAGSPIKASHSSAAMHKEVIGKMDHGWAASPTKANHSSFSMHKEDHMMGKMDHGSTGSPIKANHSSLSMRKEEHVMGKMDHGWAGSPTKANHSSLSMHKEEHKMEKMDHGWAVSPTKANHSSLSMHKEEHMMGKMDHGWAASPTNKYSTSNHMNQSNHSMYKNQGHHGWAGNNGHSYGSSQMSHSGKGSYNKHAYGDANVDDILDEILTKYPAHNVSRGHESWAKKPCASMNQTQASSCAKQEAWAGSAHHGSSAQSMGWSERKESKHAYSASSNASSYGMSGGMSNGGICVGNIGVRDHIGGHCDD